MKIGKVLKGIDKLFFSKSNDKKKQKKLKEKLLKKIEQIKEEIMTTSNDEKKQDLKDKLSILEKFLKRV
ncbi:MAG: hypothetical protein RBR33_03635 [Sulfurovaceae bacterium]|nr:hypothetical protein [Sulfurovaceae bacterium]